LQVAAAGDRAQCVLRPWADLGELIYQIAGRHRRQLRGYQFQGQRQPAASPAQGDQMRRDGVIDRQGRARFANAVGKQPHLAIAAQLHACLWRWERGKRQHGLAVDGQRYSAGRHQREHGCAAKQGGGQRGSSVYHGFAPVQYQQDTAERGEVVGDRDGRIVRPERDA
jgi:hypothetical protein